jgi:acetyl esterase/lipase
MVQHFRAEKTVAQLLSEPFDPKEVKFKPQSAKGNRALALAYVDSRAIQDRLDSVLGIENWMDEYEILPEGSVVCKLRLKFPDGWVTKSDVGSPSEQPDAGDRLKAAFSDALKRTAVKFGIGRYLYRLPAVWADYDPAKRQFAQTPELPAWARPKAPPREMAPPAPASPALPGSGDELHRRLLSFEAKLVSQKLCEPGALLEHVKKAGERAGYGFEIASWPTPAIPLAVECVREFESRARTVSTPSNIAA